MKNEAGVFIILINVKHSEDRIRIGPKSVTFSQKKMFSTPTVILENWAEPWLVTCEGCTPPSPNSGSDRLQQPHGPKRDEWKELKLLSHLFNF